MDDTPDIADRCRAIFDLVDDRNDGFIDVNRFKELVKTHSGFNLEVVTGVISVLDPEGKGLISFEEFSQGVEQIRRIQQGKLSRFNSTSSESIDSILPSDLINCIEKQSSEEDSAQPLSQSTTTSDSGSDTLTFGAKTGSRGSKTKDRGHGGELSSVTSGDSFLGDSPFITPQFHSVLCRPSGSDDADSVISGPSEPNENSRPDVTDEESYEAFGEVESEADASDPGLTPVVPRKRAEKKDLLQAKSTKKLCLARLSPRCGTPTSTGHSSSEEVFDNIDDNFSELHGRVKYLESQLLHLTKDQGETKSKQVRLKDDNSALLSRVVFLEEQLRDMEIQTQQQISDERRSHQEHMARRDREKCEEVDYVKERLHRVEKEYESLKEDSSGLRHDISRLRSEKLDLQERMLEKQEMYNVLHEDHEQLKAEYHRQEDLHSKERKSTGLLVEELGKELEDMRRYKQEVESGLRKPGDAGPEIPGRYLELQNEIHKLKEENKTLRDSNEDLNAQLVTRCVAEGKSLLDDGGTASLAEELDHLTKEELLQKLGQEQEYNQRLKQYIDRMLLIILEKSPSILEINEDAKS